MEITRRRFLTTTVLAGGALLLPGKVAFAALDPLQAKVDSGDLPPLTDRSGKPGGTWNHALVGGGSLVMLIRYQGYEPTVRFKASPLMGETIVGSRS